MDGPSTSSRPSDLATDGGDGSARPREGDAPYIILPAGCYGRKRMMVFFFFLRKKRIGIMLFTFNVC